MRWTPLLAGLALLGALLDPSPAVHAGSNAFVPPAEIYAPRVASAGPGQMWYFATNPKAVSQLIQAWLATARPVSVRPPAHQYHGIVIDYPGPAQLFFVTAGDQQLEVYPTFYVLKSARPPAGMKASPGATFTTVKYVPGVLTYTVGRVTLHVRCLPLWEYLRLNVYEPQFSQESWTQAEGRDIRRVLSSRLGRALRGFPTTPSNAPLIARQNGAPVVYATATTEASVVVQDISLVFYETWADGAKQHMWWFLLGPNGRVIQHASSGPMPPAPQ